MQRHVNRTRLSLLLVGLVLFAGCVEPSEQTIIADSTQFSDEDVIQETTVPVNETIPAVQDAVANGSSDVTDRTDAVGETEVVRSDDGYYRMNQTLVAELDATRIIYRVSTIENATADYSLSELSEKDQEMLVTASFLADESDDGTLEGQLYANNTKLQTSVLAGNTPTVVAFNGTLYRVEAFSREADTQPRYTYTAEEIASSDDGYVAYVDERYTTNLDSASAKAFFENVTFENNGSFRGVGGDSYVALDDELGDAPTIHNNVWLVEYEGERYRLFMQPEGF